MKPLPGSRRSRPLRLAVAAGVALALTVPAAAGADSIVYANVADQNIWIAAPDGTLARRVTTDGSGGDPWRNPSQADDGTILARRDTQLVRMDRRGQVLARIDTIVGGQVTGPFDPKLSPDGEKLAYSVYTSSSYETPGGIYLRTGPSVVWQDARDGRLLGATSSFATPSWLANSQQALVYDPNTVTTSQIGVAQIGANSNDVQPWLRSPPNPIGFGELTRDEARLALVQAPVSNGAPTDPGNLIALMTTNGHTGDPVGETCELRGTDGSSIRDPSWSPDGTRLAYWDGAGISATPFDGTCASLAPRVVVAGAGQADWGPADVGAAESPKVEPAGPSNPRVAAPTVRVAASLKASSLAQGLRVRLGCAGGCRARVVLKDGRRTLATRRTQVAASGTRLTLRLSRGARRALGRPGHRTLTLSVTAAGRTTTQRLAVRR